MQAQYQQKVKEQLLNNRRVTVISILNSVGTTEGRKIISRLKSEGMSIASEWVRKGKKRFKEYFLKEVN